MSLLGLRFSPQFLLQRAQRSPASAAGRGRLPWKPPLVPQNSAMLLAPLTVTEGCASRSDTHEGSPPASPEQERHQDRPAPTTAPQPPPRRAGRFALATRLKTTAGRIRCGLALLQSAHVLLSPRPARSNLPVARPAPPGPPPLAARGAVAARSRPRCSSGPCLLRAALLGRAARTAGPQRTAPLWDVLRCAGLAWYRWRLSLHRALASKAPNSP